jgi:tRNA uridine 5-carbamoylmethylation protein Kti12
LFDLSKLSESEFSDLIKKANASNLLTENKDKLNKLIDETRDLIDGLKNTKFGGILGVKLDKHQIKIEYLTFLAEEFVERYFGGKSSTEDQKRIAILLVMDSKAPSLVDVICDR